MVRTLVNNLDRLKPSAQREIVLGLSIDEPGSMPAEGQVRTATTQEPAARVSDVVGLA